MGGRCEGQPGPKRQGPGVVPRGNGRWAGPTGWSTRAGRGGATRLGQASFRRALYSTAQRMPPHQPLHVAATDLACRPAGPRRPLYTAGGHCSA